MWTHFLVSYFQIDYLFGGFSRECITLSLEHRSTCPTCAFEIDLASNERTIFPNYAVAEIADSRRNLKNEQRRLRIETVITMTFAVYIVF